MELRVGSHDSEQAPWTVLSDLAITIVLILVVYFLLQFVTTFRERAITATLAKRQHEVREALMKAVGSDSALVRVDSLAPDRQRIVLSNKLLFEVCGDKLKDSGAEVIRSVGRVIGRRQEQLETVQVEGHTDVTPIQRVTRDCPFPSNWALSSARATAVVSLLSSEQIVVSAKMSAIGRAEFHPADTTSLEPNRRVELVLQYDRGTASN